MEKNNEISEQIRNINEQFIKYQNELGEIAKETHKFTVDENSLVFENIKSIYDTFSKISEFNYATNLQDIDIKIDILTMLLPISASFVIAFLSVPTLKINLLPSILVMVASALYLLRLIYSKHKLSNELKSKIS